MEITLTGTILEGELTSTIYPGATVRYTIHVPEHDTNDKPMGLLVTHDGLNQADAYALQELARTGECPYCVTVGIHPGNLPATIPQGEDRYLRMNMYDIYSDQYPNFVVDELLPHVIKTYSLNIAPSPDMHMVSGGSSGGISAWNIAWYRTDYFHRVYMSSPSFLSMARGDELVNLIRKVETKPIRVFVDYSEEEPNDYFGNSYCIGEASIRALRFSSYDMMSQYHPGEGHCSRNNDPACAIERMRFLWNGWNDTPITVKGLSPRTEQVLLPDQGWELTDLPFPEKTTAHCSGAFTAKGVYTASGSEIYFTDENDSRTLAADGFEDISGLALSSDKWRLYIADRRRGCLYAAAIHPDGSLGGTYVHGVLHLNSNFAVPGATDFCVDAEDRIYAATEVGIQTIRSFGLIDVIITNPENRPAERLAIGNDGYLYAMCKERVYRRLLNNKQPADPMTASAPKYTSYYD